MFIEFLKNFNYYFSFFSCLFLIILIFILKNKKVNLIKVSIFILFIFLLQGIIMSYFQYLSFNNKLGKYLLPPYQSINYFIGYVFYHYFKDLFLRLIIALINLLIIIWLNFLFKQSLFYKKEYKLIFLCSILVAYPLNTLILPIGFLLILIIHIKNLILNRKSISEKINLKNYWLFIAFFLIIISIKIINSDFLKDYLFNFMP